MSDYDYTAGDDIPTNDTPAPVEINAEDIVLGGDAAVEHDSAKTEAENTFDSLPAGNHLVYVAGFVKPEKALFDTYINGQRVSYEAIKLAVKFADLANTGTILNNFRLPPSDKQGRMYYNHGTNAELKAKSAGFMAKLFGQFIDALIPGAVTENGSLSPSAQALKSWIGKKVWLQIEESEGSGQIDKRTNLPYPPKLQVKMFSFRKFVEGQPCPFPPAGSKPSRPAPAKSPALAGAGVNGSAGRSAPVDDGLDDI